MQRLLVCPADVGGGLAADGYRPVRRLPLISTVGLGAARAQLGADVLAGEVIADRQHGLEQQHLAGTIRRAPARLVPGGRAASWRAHRCGGTGHAGSKVETETS